MVIKARLNGLGKVFSCSLAYFKGDPTYPSSVDNRDFRNRGAWEKAFNRDFCWENSPPNRHIPQVDF